MIEEAVPLSLEEIVLAIGKAFLLRLDRDYISSPSGHNPAGFIYEISNADTFEAYSWGGIKSITLDDGRPFKEWLDSAIDPADEYAFGPESVSLENSGTISMKGSLTVFDYLPDLSMPKPLEHKVTLLFEELPRYKTLGDHPSSTKA